MESFLYNKPKIIGILRSPSGKGVDAPIMQQITTQKGERGKGRIDLLALNSDENLNPVLKIIELKKKAVKDDLLQLKGYLEGLNKENPWKAEFVKFIKEMGGIDDEEAINDVFNNAKGIFIVGNFEIELLSEIDRWNAKRQNNFIELYKLLQFTTKDSNFILLDKIIEKQKLKKSKRSFN